VFLGGRGFGVELSCEPEVLEDDFGLELDRQNVMMDVGRSFMIG